MTRPFPRPAAARLLGTATVLAGLAMVTACSGGAGAETKSGDEATVGPLEAMITDIVGDWNSAEQQAKQMEVEEATARCMADEGFEYIPVDYSAFNDALTAESEDTTSREYVEKNGYGFSIMSESSDDSGAVDFVDPNQEYVDAMSESEMEAYWEALYGAMDYDMEDPDAMPDMADMGCSGAAQVEIMGDQSAAFESEELTAFSEDMEKLEADAVSDPKIAEVTAKWATCMADAGLGDYANPQEVQEDFMTRSEALWEEMDPETGELPEDSELQEAERTAALADFDCKEEVGYDKVYRDVRFALEQEYIDTHEAELEAVKAAFESMGF